MQICKKEVCLKVSTIAKEVTGDNISKGFRIFSIFRMIFIYCLSIFIVLAAIFFAASKSPNKSMFGFRYYVVLTDSMVPEFSSGDMVFVKKQDYIEDKEIGVFLLGDNEVTVKKAAVDKNGITLKAANKKYPDRRFRPDEIQILGRVLHNKVMF